MIHSWLTVADRPPGGGAIEREAVARLQILLPILLFALEIAGQSQDFNIAREGIVAQAQMRS